MKANVIQKEFPNLKVSVLSVGKHKNNPLRNEDGWVAKVNTFAVIDGSAPRVDLRFEGKSSARFATDVVRKVLLTTPPDVNGKELVSEITTALNREINREGYRKVIQKNKEATPAALFTTARIVGDKVIVTGLGDISCRINEKVIHSDHFKSEDLMTEKRILAMKNAKKKNPSISDEELVAIGQKTIKDDLIYQVKNYFNNSNSDLGLGIIDGEEVPEKFIKEYKYDLKDVKTLELFSDGYYSFPDFPSIDLWEEKFFQGEKEDPLRWNKYPAVKAVLPGQFSDDRTILIVAFNK
ncbi:MAG: hypothetical protein ABH816_02485 [Candidatus Levyibacteriota bacterium]